MKIAFELIAKLILSPLLFWQARRVRKHARTLPAPPGARSGRYGNGPPLSLMILGDSAAAGVGVDHQDRAISGNLMRQLGRSYQVDWRLVARVGATTREALPLLSGQTPKPTDIIIVVLGVNDVTRQVFLKKLMAERARLYEQLRTNWHPKRVIVAGIPPIDDFPLLPQPMRWLLGLQADRFDNALKQQAEEIGIEYLPFDIPLTPQMMAEDQFHPGANTYAIVARRHAQKILHL